MSEITSYNPSALTSEYLFKNKLTQAKSTIHATAQEQSSLDSAQDKRIRKVAEDFEAMFISQMLQPMFQDIPVDETMGGGSAEKTFRGMMVTEMGKGMAKSGGIGLADTIYKEMLKMQEVAA